MGRNVYRTSPLVTALHRIEGKGVARTCLGKQAAVIVAAKIAPTGEVDKADVASNTGLSPEVATCISRAVRNANFAAPGGSGSAIQIPVTFVQQK